MSIGVPDWVQVKKTYYGTSIPFEEKSSDRFKDPPNLKLLTKFDVNLTSSPGEVMN